MKRQLAGFGMAIAALASLAEVENMSLSLKQGQSQGKDLGIVPKNYQIVDRDIVNVTLVEGSTTAIIGARNVPGTCQVKFNDANGGDGVLLKVTIRSTVDDKMDELRRRLSEFDNVESSRLGEKIILEGTVSSPRQWAELQKICGLDYFKNDVNSLVEFRVAPATIEDLRKALKDNGLKLVADGGAPGLGEVAMEYEHNVIRFSGTVFSQEALDTLQRVLAGKSWLKVVDEAKDAAFSTIAQAVVQVRPVIDPSELASLKEDLKKAGFKLAADGALPGEGEISIRQDRGMKNALDQIMVSGSVYSSEDRAKLERVLRSRPWLKVGTNENVNAVANAALDVAVDDSLLELGVAFLKVSKSASKNLGSFHKDKKTGNLVADTALEIKEAVSGSIRGFHDFLTGRHSPEGSSHFKIDADLNKTLTFLAENSVTREKEYGTIRFHANGDSGKKLHLGGKLTVTPPATGEGEAPEPQEYEYGFKIVNRNSHRLSATEAEADVEIEFNGEPVADPHFGGTSVRQETRSIHPTVRVPLGQTVAVAGYESLMESTTLPSGTPWLRNVPILNWFVSGQGEDLKDYTLLFLVSVRKVDVESEAPMVENTPMKDITLPANTDNKTRIKEEQEKNKPDRGCTPLNWFRF
ncbi:MAG: hypothetical protein IJK04_06285 [Kiritimatiellae bacterium]|nr:hypothetical protein [Kiritimatiellia bacterium]